MPIIPTNYVTVSHKALERTAEESDDYSVMTIAAVNYRKTTAPLYGLSPARLFTFLEENKTKRVAFIDARDAGTLQFRDANHFGLVDTSNYETLKTRFNKFKTENPERFANLLLKDIVIVHCAQGANRSPPMVAIYADAHKNAAYGTANLNQKIIFLKSGIDAFAIVDTVPHKFLVPWEGHGPDTELTKAKPTFSTGPGSVTKPRAF